MIINFEPFSNFSPESRVWIYQASRYFSETEFTEATKALAAFTNSWLSHGDRVKGAFMVMSEGFIILAADNNVTQVGGCSTDSSVRVIKELDARFELGLFDRQLLAFLIEKQAVRIPLSQLPVMIEEKQVLHDTPYFNNMVQTLAELKSDWLVPAAKSWLSKKFQAIENVVN